MKRKILLLFISTSLLFACSSDDNASKNAIIGSWRAIEFKAADATNSNVDFGAEVLTNLVEKECYVLTFTFKEDLSFVSENGLDHLEINASATGIEVECPTQQDSETSTYTYDGTTLIIVDAAGETVSIKVTVSGNTLTADAADLNIPNLDADGELIFERY